MPFLSGQQPNQPQPNPNPTPQAGRGGTATQPTAAVPARQPSNRQHSSSFFGATPAAQPTNSYNRNAGASMPQPQPRQPQRQSYSPTRGQLPMRSSYRQPQIKQSNRQQSTQAHQQQAQRVDSNDQRLQADYAERQEMLQDDGRRYAPATFPGQTQPSPSAQPGFGAQPPPLPDAVRNSLQPQATSQYGAQPPPLNPAVQSALMPQQPAVDPGNGLTMEQQSAEDSAAREDWVRRNQQQQQAYNRSPQPQPEVRSQQPRWWEQSQSRGRY